VITDDELANMPPVIECAVHNAFGLLVPEMWAESPDFRVIEDGDGVNARILVRLGDPVVITDEEGPELFDILSFQAPLAFRDREDFAAAGDAYEQTVEALKWAQPQSASPKRTSVVDRISMRDGRAIEREVTPRLRAGLCLDGA